MDLNLAMGSVRLSNPISEPVFKVLSNNNYCAHSVYDCRKSDEDKITMPLLNYNMVNKKLDILS